MTDIDWSEKGSLAPTNESEKRESMHMVENRATARQSSTPETSHPIHDSQSQPTDANRLATITGLNRDPITIIARLWTISEAILNTLPLPALIRPMALGTKLRRRSIKTATHPPRIRIRILKPLRVALHSPTIPPTEPLWSACTLLVAPAKTSTSNLLLGITTLRMAPRRTTLPDREMEMTIAIKSINATF